MNIHIILGTVKLVGTAYCSDGKTHPATFTLAIDDTGLAISDISIDTTQEVLGS